MTGFGSHTDVMFGREVTVEIKSVNSRYLDLNIKTPRSYSFLEEHIKKNITALVSRGKVEVFVSVGTNEISDTSIEVNHVVLNQYLKALNEISNITGVKNDVTNTFLSKCPEIISFTKSKADEDEIIISVTRVLEKAIEKFDNMRENEAFELKNDIRIKALTILDYVKVIEENSVVSLERYKERLFLKLKEVLDQSHISEERILAEATIYSDKIAVDEETVRLRSHILQLEQMLNSEEPIGRKIDFLIQEINREVNTIGSKCSDISITNIVIEIKSLVEKIREQIQNIE